MLGPDNKPTLDCAYWLGQTLYIQNRYKEAADVYRQVQEGFRETIGLNHKMTLEATFSLGQCLYEQNEYEEAEWNHVWASSCGTRDGFWALS